MKKLLVLTLSLATALSIMACEDSGSANGGGSAAPVENVDNAVEPAGNADAAVEPDADIGSDDEFTLWDVAKEEIPDLNGTTWSFAGGYVDGREMTEEEVNSALEMYGGVCQFVFDAEGGVQLVQGGGTLEGTYEFLEDGIGVVFDANGTELAYACIFTDMGGITMIAISDGVGNNGMYLAP